MDWTLVENTATRRQWRKGNATVTMDISPRPGPWYVYMVSGEGLGGAGFETARNYTEAMGIVKKYMKLYQNDPTKG
jgi:hypothetical protein